MQSAAIIEKRDDNTKELHKIGSKYCNKRIKELQRYIDCKDQTAGLSYYSVVHEIIHWQLSFHARLYLLQKGARDKSNRNIGMIIAKNGDNSAIQALLEYVKKIHCDGTNKEFDHLYSFLTEQSSGHSTLGDYIAVHNDYATIKQYLDLLHNLKEHGSSSRKIFNLISQKNDYKWHFGNFVAHFQKPHTVSLFLSFLSSLLQDGITAQEIFDLISSWCCSINTSKDHHSWTMGHLLAFKQNATVIIQFFELLECLNKLGVSRDQIIDYLHSKNYKNENIYVIMLEQLKAKELYQLICHNIFRDMKNKKPLAEKKAGILSYVNTLTGENKIEALQNALTPTHPLYELFSIQRGFRETSLEKGSFAKIITALGTHAQSFIEQSIASNATNKVKHYSTSTNENTFINESTLAPPPSYYSQHNKTIVNTAGKLYPVYAGDDQFTNPTTPPIIQVNANSQIIAAAFEPTVAPETDLLIIKPMILDISKGYIAESATPSTANEISTPNITIPSLAAAPLSSKVDLPLTPAIEQKNSSVGPSLMHSANKIFEIKGAAENRVEKEIITQEKKQQKRQAILA